MIVRLWESVRDNILAPSRLNFAQLPSLLFPWGRSPALLRYTAAVIMARVQIIAAIFAILVPCGAIIDFLVFETNIAWRMTGLRLLSAALFVLLAWPREQSVRAPYRQAMAMLALLLLIPPLFHLLSADMLHAAAHTDMQRLLMQIYSYLPTIVLGGMSIFPLTALEIGLLAVPVIYTAGIGYISGGMSFSLTEQGGMLWFMTMMLGVSMFSGMSQSHYMVSLMHRAMHDPLTAAFTRSSGEEALNLLFRLGGLSGKPLVIAFIDLDRFKSINDSFGHDAGDNALRMVAERLRQTFRRTDLLIRWGGEEFLAVLPDTPPAHVLGLFQRLREQGFGCRPDGAPITASIGIAASTEPGINDWQDIVARADQRMYSAKEQGRDRIVFTES